MSQTVAKPSSHIAEKELGFAGFTAAILAGLVVLALNFMQPAAVATHSLRSVESPQHQKVASALDAGAADEVLGDAVSAVSAVSAIDAIDPAAVVADSPAASLAADRSRIFTQSVTAASVPVSAISEATQATEATDSSEVSEASKVLSHLHVQLHHDVVPAVSADAAEQIEAKDAAEVAAPRHLAAVPVAPIAPIVPNPPPVQVRVAVVAEVEPAPAVAPVQVQPAPAAAPVQVEPAPAVAPVQVQAAPVAPVQVPAAPAVASVQVQAAVAATGRSGPAGVVSQIPASAYAWTDANGWRIDWRQGPGPGRIAEAQYATSTIVIWYDTNRSDATWAGAVGHELGHAVSYRHFSTAQMNEWNAMRGLSSWRWVPGTSDDFSVGEGDFAEAFMSYLLGHPIRSVGGPLTQQQRAWIAANTPF